MRKFSFLLSFGILFLTLQSCTAYYICDSKTVIPIYSSTTAEKVVYTVPTGEKVLVKGKSGNLRYTQFGYYYGWANANQLRYLSATTPKRYFETFSEKPANKQNTSSGTAKSSKAKQNNKPAKVVNTTYRN